MSDEMEKELREIQERRKLFNDVWKNQPQGFRDIMQRQLDIDEAQVRAMYGQLTPSQERSHQQKMEEELRQRREHNVSRLGESLSVFQDEIEEEEQAIRNKYELPPPMYQPSQPSYSSSYSSPPMPLSGNQQAMNINMDIECPNCGAINEVEYDPVTLEYISPIWGSTICEECGSPLFDGEDGEDTDEEQDDRQFGYFRDEPPVYARSSLTTALGEDDQSELLPAFAPASHSAVVLGRGINQKTEREEVVVIGDVERRSGVYMLGKPGMGKTTLMVNMILQDIEHGHGLCFLDPHGDAIEEVLRRLPEWRKDDVIFIDPLDKASAIGLNLYQCLDPSDDREVSRTVNYVMAIFAKLFADGDLSHMPQMAQVLRNTSLTLIENPGMTMAEIPLLLDDEEARAKLTKNVTNPQVRLFWTRYNRMKASDQQQFTASTVNKLDEFLALPFIQYIVGQSITTISFRDVMDEGKILLVKLSREQAQLTTLIGSLIIGQLLNAAYSRDNIPEDQRRHFCLYCDEFQNFATPDFAKLITEGRKYRIATTIAHQERASQFEKDDKNRGATLAAANIVVFQLTVKDAQELAPDFARQPPPAWEEELEPERIKVIRPQQHRRVEEQITEYIEEDEEEISTSPVEFLVSARGTHGSVKVREATQAILVPLEQAAGGKGKQVTGDYCASPFVQHFTMLGDDHTTCIAPVWAAGGVSEGKWLLNSLLVDVMEGRVGVDKVQFGNRMASILTTLAGFIGWFGLHEYSYMVSRSGTVLFNNVEYIEPDETLRQSLSGIVQAGERYRQEFSDLLLSVLRKRIHGIRNSETEYTWNRDEERLQVFSKDAANSLVSFVSHLKALCEELAKEPIMVPIPGKKRMVPRTRTQVNWLTDESEKLTIPRKTILHPQPSSAEMVTKMEQELIDLPRFTAYAKIVQERGGKQLVSKYRLTTDDWRPPDRASVVAQRIQDIRANTIGCGYVTDREKVRQEIEARRNELLKKEQKRGQTTVDDE